MRYLKLYEDFDKVAFHGYQMTPQDMRLPDCEVEWKGPEQETGCPRFSNEKRLTKDDIEKAVTFLNEEDVKTIIGYSRGGAILLNAFILGARVPEKVYFTAAAWGRQWADIKPMEIDTEGYVIHGGLDDKVPLRHSAILAKATGFPLYVFPDLNHVSILKKKDDVTGGILVNHLDEAIASLPDWGKSDVATQDELEEQRDWCSRLD